MVSTRYDCGEHGLHGHSLIWISDASRCTGLSKKEILVDTSCLDGEVLQHLNEVIIKITHTASMDLSSPDVWTSEDSEASEQRYRNVQQFVDILTNLEMNKRADQLIYKNQRYNKDDEPPISSQLSKVIKKGYSKSTAIVGDCGKEQEALLLVEPRCSAFFQPACVEKYFDDVRSEFHVSPSTGKFRLELEKHLTGLHVATTHRQRPLHLTIKGISNLTVGEQTFTITKDGRTFRVTVARYYEDTYKIPTNSEYPCVVVEQMLNGKRQQAYYPCEVLKVTPGQRVPTQKQSAKLVDHLVVQSRMLPWQLKEAAVAEVKKCDLYYGSDHMKAFGISLEHAFRSAPARVLPAPVVLYGNEQGVPTDDETNLRRWHARGTAFVKPANLRDGSWAVVVIEGALHCETTRKFVSRYRACAWSNGMDFGDPIITRLQRADMADIWDMSRFFRSIKIKFVLYIIGGDRRSIERDLLKESETMFRFVTQSVNTKTVIKIMLEHNEMTLQSIIMKTNLKLGGINHDFLALRQQPTSFAKRLLPHNRMFIGLDMQSPGLLGSDPTVVGICFTIGSAADMRGTYWYQRATFKHMTILNHAVTIALKAYMKQNNDSLPRDIVVFRGGVSESEMALIAREEITQIESAFQSTRFKYKEEYYKPQLTVIFAQKQCGVRLMPTVNRNNFQGPRSQNVVAGTCVSSGITCPNRTEYILVAQNGRIGTSRPTRYVVMHETGAPFSVQQLENMTNALCYLHGIVTSPVSRPAPLFSAADLVKRGRANWNARKVRRQGTSSAGSNDEDFHDINQRLLFLPQKLGSKFWA